MEHDCHTPTVQKLRKIVFGASVSIQYFTNILLLLLLLLFVTCFLYILDTVI